MILWVFAALLLPLAASAASAAPPARRPVSCIIKSREDALEKVRDTRALFTKLQKSRGFWDAISKATGCPSRIREILDESLTEYETRAKDQTYPLDAGGCADLVVRMDRIGGWIRAYKQARGDHGPNVSDIPDVCLTGKLSVTYSDPCDRGAAQQAMRVMSEAATQQASAIDQAAQRMLQETGAKATPGQSSTPKPPAAARPARPPTEAKLADQAREALKAYKKTGPQGPDGIDLDRFMIDAEARAATPRLSEAEYNRIKRLWVAKKKEYARLVAATPGDQEAKTRRLMKAIHKDFLHNYCIEEARLSGFLGPKRCGNCEAETLLEAVAIHALGLVPDGPSRLTVQRFGDHIQAIIYRPASATEPQRLWNLLTGRISHTVTAPLYGDIVLVHGYVQAHGGGSPLTDADLLVAGIDPGVSYQTVDLSKNPATNSILALPSSPSYFGNGPAPKAAQLEAPLDGSEEPAALAGPPPPSTGPEDLATREQALRAFLVGPAARTLREIYADPLRLKSIPENDFSASLWRPLSAMHDHLSGLRSDIPYEAARIASQDELLRRVPQILGYMDRNPLQKLHQTDPAEFYRVCDQLGASGCGHLQSLAIETVNDRGPPDFSKIMHEPGRIILRSEAGGASSAKNPDLKPGFGHLRTVPTGEAIIALHPDVYARSFAIMANLDFEADSQGLTGAWEDVRKLMEVWTPETSAALRKYGHWNERLGLLIMGTRDHLWSQVASRKGEPTIPGLFVDPVPLDIATLQYLFMRQQVKNPGLPNFLAHLRISNTPQEIEALLVGYRAVLISAGVKDL